MKYFDFTGKVLIFILGVLVLLMVSGAILNRNRLITDYQLEEMKRLKEHCEAENPNKECILMFDYWAVEKYVE